MNPVCSVSPESRPTYAVLGCGIGGLAPIIHYFQQNAARMPYGTYRQRGDFIGSGAIERAGKPMTAARIKGPGMRWNVTDLNALLALRCVFL